MKQRSSTTWYRSIQPNTAHNPNHTGWPSRGQPGPASQLADRIAEVAPLPTTASIAQAPKGAGLLQKIEDLSRQAAVLTNGRTRQHSHSRYGRKANDVPIQPTGPRSAITVGTIGDSGTRREDIHHRTPSTSRKTAATALMAADAFSAPSGRLFISDRVRKLRFLIDTGSDVCVVPRRLAPVRRERISYDLFVANGTPIATYGWHTLTLNIGLRRDFTWRFVVVDVQLPIIGADFHANFSLLVDCRNNRLLDGVTSLSTSAQTASTRFPSIKTIGIGTPADKLFA